MGLKHLHWLDITEYGFLALTIIGSAFAITSQNVVYALVPIGITLILSRINRLRAEYHLRASFLKLYRKVSGELNALDERQQTLETEQGKVTEQLAASETGKEAQAIASLQEYLASVEQSLSSVVQYLNSTALPERVESLEEASSKLVTAIAQISRHLPEGEERLFSDSEQAQSLATATPNPPNIIPTTSIITAPRKQRWKCIHTLKEHTDRVTGLGMSQDGRFLVSVSWDKTLKLWEIATGKLLSTQMSPGKGLLTVTWSQQEEQNVLATGSFDHTIQLWCIENIESEKPSIRPTQVLEGHRGSVRSLMMTPEGKTLFSGSYDQTIKQWELNKGQLVQSWHDQSGSVCAIALSSEGQMLASSGGDGRITLWELNQETPWKVLKGNVDSIESLSLKPNGKLIAAGCIEGSIKFWQLDSQQSSPDFLLPAHQGAVHTVLFSKDGETLISGGADGSVKLWQLTEAHTLLLASLESEAQQTSPSSINALTLAPDEELLATGSLDGTIRIWLRE